MLVYVVFALLFEVVLETFNFCCLLVFIILKHVNLHLTLEIKLFMIIRERTE